MIVKKCMNFVNKNKERISPLHFLTVGLFAGACLFLTGCESEESRKLSHGQECLDQATPSTVDQCLSAVEGIQSPKAYLIRCSAHYIAQGFTTTRFVNAFKNLKETTGGTNPTLTAMAFMAFDDTTPALALHTSTTTLDDCESSGVRSLFRLATMTRMASVVAGAAGAAIDPTTGAGQAQMLTYVQNFVSNGGDPAELGTLAQTASAAYCTEGSAFKTSEICTTLEGAIDGATPTDIGNQLLALLQ